MSCLALRQGRPARCGDRGNYHHPMQVKRGPRGVWRPPREVLYRLYVDELWTAREIGYAYGVSPSTAHHHLRRLGIPMRKRGHSGKP